MPGCVPAARTATASAAAPVPTIATVVAAHALASATEPAATAAPATRVHQHMLRARLGVRRGLRRWVDWSCIQWLRDRN